MNVKDKMELFIWECEKCGRKSPYKFYEHAPFKSSYAMCDGKVRRIKWKNAW